MGVSVISSRRGMEMALAFLLSSLILLSSTGVLAHTNESDLYAVVVGVRRFLHREQIQPLTVSDKDASDFAAFLKEHKHLFSRAHVRLILNEEGTRKNVATAIRNELESAREDDLVVVYLSGHGLAHPTKPNEYYYFTYDTEPDKLYATSLMINDKKLFAGVKSRKVLLLADACHSGGFLTGIERDYVPKGPDERFSVFRDLPGRAAIASSGPSEVSYEKRLFGNGVFTYFLIKGLRGDAFKRPNHGELVDARVTIQDLYEYIACNTRAVTHGKQNPQIYTSAGYADFPIVKLPAYERDLELKVQFQYQGEDGRVRPLNGNTVLKSGQRLGLVFRSVSDCYVYLFWWDLSGKVWQMFPNPQYGTGEGRVMAGRTYWLPSQGDMPHWYVLNDTPGYETIYLVASRERNPKLEHLCGVLTSLAAEAGKEEKARSLAAELEREVNFLGPAEFTEPRVNVQPHRGGRPEVFEDLGNQIRVSGADAIFKIRFRHE